MGSHALNESQKPSLYVPTFLKIKDVCFDKFDGISDMKISSPSDSRSSLINKDDEHNGKTLTYI